MKTSGKILISAITGLCFLSLGIDSSFAIGITVFTVLDLAMYGAQEIPIIQYMSFIFTLNFLFVPFILYQFGINDYIPAAYQLRIGQAQLFSYLIPCMLALLIGLRLFNAKKYQSIDIEQIKQLRELDPSIPRNLMVIGLISYFAHSFAPSSLEYILFLLSDLRYVALFLLLLSFKRVPIWYYVFSYGILIIQAITNSMFNDFLNLLFFLGFVLNIRYKPGWPVKLAAAVSIIFLINTIQSVKFIFRSQVTGILSNDLSSLNSSLDEAAAVDATLSADERLANTLLRLDQAWVTSSSISFYEGNGYELQNGDHFLVIAEAVLLPRIIAPDKVTSGSNNLFNTYSGHTIEHGTAIALGAPTDGFIDWGYFGWIFMFFYGLIFNLCLRFIHKNVKVFPILFAFIPIIFYYAVRPDSESQTTLSNVFKATLLVYGFLLLYNRWQTIKVVKRLKFKNI